MSEPTPTRIGSLEHLFAQRHPVRHVSQELNQNQAPLEKAAVQVTQRVGSIGFFFIILTWTVLWLGWNTLAPSSLRFDPPKGFILWLFFSNMIQLFLMPLILIGQNAQGRSADLRSQSDYEVNLKTERETRAILEMLAHQAKLIEELTERRDGPATTSP